MINITTSYLLGSELGDSLGTLRNSVLGKLSGKDETNSSLNFTRSDSGLLVVASEFGGLDGDLLEDVVDERVHDGHSLGGDTSIGVDLLEDLVDVDLVSLGFGLLASGRLSGSLLGGGLSTFGNHFELAIELS